MKTALLLTIVLTGCTPAPPNCTTFCDLGVITVNSDMAAPSEGDLAQSPATTDLATVEDMAAPPDMTLAPPYFFDPVIQADVDRYSCAVSCHSTQSRILIANPKTVADIDSNYQALVTDARMGANSLLLTKLLDTSGVIHGGNLAGTKPFTNTNDPTYQRWLVWINAGAIERP